MSTGTNKERIEQNNTLLEDIKTQIQNLPEAGGSGDIKLFKTEEEMQADTTAKEGDLAIVYRSEVKNATVDSKFQTATFPDTVVLDNAMTDYVEVRYRAVDSSKMFDCWGSLDSSRFMMDCYTETGEVRIQYTSSDGITYTRTDTNGNPVDFGTEIYYAYPEMWNDAIGKFIQASGNTFEGLYKAENKLTHIVNYNYRLENGEVKYDSVEYDFDQLYEDLRLSHSSGSSLKLVSNYAEGKPTRYWYSGYANQCLIHYNGYIYFGCTSSNDIDNNYTVCYRDIGGSDVYPDISNATKVTINSTNYYIFTASQTVDDDNIRYFCDNSASASFPMYYIENNTVYNIPIVANTGNYYPQWELAPTQLTLSNVNELLPGKIGYGKNGVVTGDGTIYSNLDGLTLLSTVLGYTPETVSNSPIFSKANDVIPIDTFLGEIYTNNETDCVTHLLKDEDILTSVKSKINEYVGTTDMIYNLVGVKNNELLFKAYKYVRGSGETCVVHCAACKYNLETNQFTNKVYTTYNVSDRSMSSKGEKYFPDINMLIISAYGYSYKNIYVLVNYNDMTIHYMLKSCDTSVGEIGYYLVGDYIYSFNGNSANDLSVDRIRYTDYTLTTGVIKLSGSTERDYNSFILNNQQYILYLDRDKNLYLFTPKTNGTVTKALLATFTATSSSYLSFMTIVHPVENKAYSFFIDGNVTLNNNVYIGFVVDSSLNVTWLLDNEWTVEGASSSSIPSMDGIITRYNNATNTLTSISMSSTYNHVICDFSNKNIIDRSSTKNTFGKSLPYGISNVANIYNKTDYTDDNMNITIIDYYMFINDTIKKIRNCYCFGNVLTTMNNTVNKDVYSIVIKHGQDDYNNTSIIILNTNLLNNKINQVLNTNKSTQQ